MPRVGLQMFAQERITMVHKKRPRSSTRRGTIVVLIALLMVPLLFALVMVVDVGCMYIVQAELQAAADAAALAAAGEMSRATTDVYLTRAIQGAKAYVAEHGSLGMGNLQLADSDIEFGDAVFDATRSMWTFVPGSSSSAPYAVRVTVRRDGPTNPRIPRFFARIFGASDGEQSATAAAMITPRDIALVVDLSQSMTFDSMLIHRDRTQINLRDVWATLDGPDGSPSTKTIAGAGEFITNYELRTPDTSVYASREGQTFGSMAVWGTTILQGQYNQVAVEADPGLYWLPERSRAPTGGWSATLGGASNPRYQWLVENLSNPYSLKSRGHNATQITNLLKKPTSETVAQYQRRVKVLLGLAAWNDSNGDNLVGSAEVTEVVSEPYVQGQGWDAWIEDVRNASGLTYNSSYGGASYFRDRYGLKSYVNWLMDCQFAKDYPVSGSSGYTPQLQFTVAEPVQAIKDAVEVFSEYLKSVESNDRVGMVVYGTSGASDPFSATNGLTNDFDQIGDLPYPHQAGEHGRFTNTAEAVVRGYLMIHGLGSRPHAHKVIVFMSDGCTTVYNHFNYLTDLDNPVNIALLGNVQSTEDLQELLGGFPSSSLSTGGSADEDGRLETLGIGRMLASNYIGLGDVEFNVVGVGADADIAGLLQPLAEASGGDAYYAEPDPSSTVASAESDL
jgi:Flp pilus assembly protein TadG